MRENLKKLEAHDDCHPVMVDALHRFNEKITSALSTTAYGHKFSIWSLLEKEVEPSLIQAFGANFFGAIAKDGFALNAKKDARKLENRIRSVARSYSRLDLKISKNRQIYGTLETLIAVIHFCKSFRPHTYSVRVGNESKGELIRRLAYRANLHHFPFCELCERLCEAAETKVVGDKHAPKDRATLSSRFCSVHKSGSSAYRRDHNYREAFHRKIDELGYALGHGTYTEGIEELKALLDEQFYFDEEFMNAVWAGVVEPEIVIEKDEELRRHLKNYPESYSEFDAIVRAVAYRIVHPKKEQTRRKTSLGGKGATLEKLKEALTHGKSIAEASRDAGVSRQAGWKALKKAGDI